MRCKIREMKRVVWDLPTPVRTAVTAMTGLRDRSMVAGTLRSEKRAPHRVTREARSIKKACETSEYENHTSSIRSRAISPSSSASATMGTPSG